MSHSFKKLSSKKAALKTVETEWNSLNDLISSKSTALVNEKAKFLKEKNELKVQKKILEHQRLEIEATWKFENMHEMTPRLERYENQQAKFQKAEKTL